MPGHPLPFQILPCPGQLRAGVVAARKGSVRDGIYARSSIGFYNICAVLLVSTLVFGAYGVGYDSSQFIYTQF